MLYKLIQDCRMINPEYTKATRETTPRFITVAAGKIIECTDEAISLCIGNDPKLEPACEESSAALLAFLSQPGRSHELAKLMVMNSLKADLSSGEAAYTSELYERNSREISERIVEPMLMAATLLEPVDTTLSETLRKPEAASQDELDAAIEAVQALPGFEHTLTVTNTLKLLRE